MWARRWVPRLLRHRQPLRWQSTTLPSGPQISPALLSRARALSAEHAHLSQKLEGHYDSDAARKAGSLATVATALSNWEAANDTLPELQQLVRDPSTDAELRSLATEDLEATHEKLSRLSNELQTSLIPAHPFATFPCLLELRPGAGGDEAAIFAGDLLRMYTAFCKARGLRCNIVSLDTEAATGSEDKIREAVLEIDLPGAYDVFRCEAGVHRVQRVPATEAKGRTHTSAVSVMVLPSFANHGPEDESEAGFDDPASDYYIDATEVKVETMRSSGAGGQHVNTTDSAVRLTHLPTNTTVAVQEQRSQMKNRQKAWQVLRGRLAQRRREAREEEMAALRGGRAAMGRGDKVRTYNWSQQRVTDHRAGVTVHNLDDVMEGGENLEKVMDAVKRWLKTRDLEAMVAEEDEGGRNNKGSK